MFLIPAQAIRWFLAAGLLGSCPLLRADTFMVGGNIGNQTWNTGGSPYIVQGDVSVQAGQTLTIEAGVEVRFSPFDMQGAGRDPARVEMTVNGVLDVQGTAAAPVVMRGQTANMGSWYGIIAGPSADQVKLDGASIQHAVNAVLCESGSADFSGSNLILSTNRTAINVAAGQPVLTQVAAFGNQTAINVGPQGALTLADSVIHGNSVQAVQVNSSASGAITLRRCTIHGNGTYGFQIGAGSTAPIHITSTIVSGSDYGIYRAVAGSGLVSVTYSDVWGNTSNLVNVTAGPRVISEDPLYIDADGVDNVFGNADDNLRLQPNSPCGYAGLGGEDIGAYSILKLFMFRPELVGEEVRIRFTSVPDRIHQLQFTEDFTAWIQVGNSVIGTGASLYITNFGVRNLPKRFYRIGLED